MTWFVEESPSNRAICRSCGRKILLGEMRAGQPQTSGWGHRYYHYYCSKCSVVQLDNEIRDLDKAIKRLINFNRENGYKYVETENIVNV